MDDWGKNNGTLLPEKDLYSHLNMEDFTDADDAHKKQLVKILKQNSEYHDLYVQNNALLLPDVFKIFQNLYRKIN